MSGFISLPCVGGPMDGQMYELPEDADLLFLPGWCKQPTPNGFRHGMYRKQAAPITGVTSLVWREPRT